MTCIHLWRMYDMNVQVWMYTRHPVPMLHLPTYRVQYMCILPVGGTGTSYNLNLEGSFVCLTQNLSSIIQYPYLDQSFFEAHFFRVFLLNFLLDAAAFQVFLCRPALEVKERPASNPNDAPLAMASWLAAKNVKVHPFFLWDLIIACKSYCEICDEEFSMPSVKTTTSTWKEFWPTEAVIIFWAVLMELRIPSRKAVLPLGATQLLRKVEEAFTNVLRTGVSMISSNVTTDHRTLSWEEWTCWR